MLYPMASSSLGIQCQNFYKLCQRQIMIQMRSRTRLQCRSDTVGSSCRHCSNQNGFNTGEVPLSTSYKTLAEAQDEKQCDGNKTRNPYEVVIEVNVIGFSHNGRDQREKTKETEAKECYQTVAEGILFISDQLKFLNHHNFQKSLLVLTKNRDDLIRHLRLQSHLVVNMNHLLLLCFEILLHFQAFSFLLRLHVLGITLCSEVICDCHGDSIGQKG